MQRGERGIMWWKIFSFSLFFFHFILLLFGSLNYLTCRDWSYEGSPTRIPSPIPFLSRTFVYLFLFFLNASSNLLTQNLALPAEGGTNPYPLAPTMTPLLSAVLGGGPGGNNTGPTEKKIICVNINNNWTYILTIFS